jgi:hypothetical protein
LHLKERREKNEQEKNEKKERYLCSAGVVSSASKFKIHYF